MTFVIRCTSDNQQSMYWQNWDGKFHQFTLLPKTAYRFDAEAKAQKIANNINRLSKVIPFHTALTEHHGSTK